MPFKVTAIGGHFLFDDDQQTPNTITAIYEFRTPDGKTKMMNFEVRGWMTNHEAEIGTREFNGGDVPAAGLAAAAPKTKSLGPAEGVPSTIGNIYYGSKGYLAISNYGAYKSFLGVHNEPGPSKETPLGNEHFVNFIECIRSRKAEDIHAPIREGYLSTTLVHLANASYRLGRTIHFDPATETVKDDSEATAMLKGTYPASICGSGTRIAQTDNQSVIFVRRDFFSNLSGKKPEMTATESALAAKTSLALARVTPPMAQSCFFVSARTALRPAIPTTGSGFSFDVV